MNLCSKCGAQLKDNAKFCGKCGTVQDQQAPPQPVKQPVQKPVQQPMQQPVQQQMQQPVQQQMQQPVQQPMPAHMQAHLQQEAVASNSGDAMKVAIFGVIAVTLIAILVVLVFVFFIKDSDDVSDSSAVFQGFDRPVAVAPPVGEVVLQEEAAPEAVSSGYLAPSDTQYLTDADLSGLSSWEVTLARNELYARYGYSFQNEEIRNYFLTQSWYSPNAAVHSGTFQVSTFNAYESANLDFIIKYAQARGW